LPLAWGSTVEGRRMAGHAFISFTAVVTPHTSACSSATWQRRAAAVRPAVHDMQTEVVTNGAMPSRGFLTELRRLVGTQPPPAEPPKADPPPQRAAAEDPSDQAFDAGGFGDLFDRIVQRQPARGRDVEADIALKPHVAAARGPGRGSLPGHPCGLRQNRASGGIGTIEARNRGPRRFVQPARG
jgi:hypothetical protein